MELYFYNFHVGVVRVYIGIKWTYHFNNSVSKKHFRRFHHIGPNLSVASRLTPNHASILLKSKRKKRTFLMPKIAIPFTFKRNSFRTLSNGIAYPTTTTTKKIVDANMIECSHKLYNDDNIPKPTFEFSFMFNSKVPCDIQMYWGVNMKTLKERNRSAAKTMVNTVDINNAEVYHQNQTINFDQDSIRTRLGFYSDSIWILLGFYEALI